MKYLPAFIFLLTLLSCKKTEIITPDITTGLVASFSLDGNGYEEVSGINGVMHNVNPAISRHGKANKSMLFNRNDSSFIDFGDLEALSFPNNQFTISCWINVSDSVAPICMLSKRSVYGPWEYSLDNHFNHAVFNLDNWIPDGSTTVYGTDPLKASAILKLNLWSHVAYVADGIILKVYLNGILQSGEDALHAGLFLQDTNAHFVIGNGGGYGKNYYFNGSIDDVSIYNRPLDAATIQYLALQ
ncbi:MAG: LamG domain-containing protein [Chitinophagales bacterium]